MTDDERRARFRSALRAIKWWRSARLTDDQWLFEFVVALRAMGVPRPERYYRELGFRADMLHAEGRAPKTAAAIEYERRRRAEAEQQEAKP